jgi:hypothetical protein
MSLPVYIERATVYDVAHDAVSVVGALASRPVQRQAGIVLVVAGLGDASDFG